MSAELQRARERYRADAANACRLASLTLIPHVGLNFHITGWTARGRDAYTNQWLTSRFDWPEVYRRHTEPDRLDMAMWSPDGRLCGLGLCLTTGRAVELRFLEGCATDGCPLKGFRAVIALEVAACYAQLRGKVEVRLVPLNERLSRFYVDLYGFEAVRPSGGQPYLRRLV